MTAEQKKLIESWRTILSILKETGYDFMYQDEITRVANALRKAVGMDD